MRWSVEQRAQSSLAAVLSGSLLSECDSTELYYAVLRASFYCNSTWYLLSGLVYAVYAISSLDSEPSLRQGGMPFFAVSSVYYNN